MRSHSQSLPTLAERRRPKQQRALTLSAAIEESEQRSQRREAAVQSVARRIFEQLQSVMREPNISTASAARRLSRRVSLATATKTAASLVPPWERAKTAHLDPARAAEVFGGYESWKIILDSADTDNDGFVDEEEWVQYVLESAREEGFTASQASLAAMLADLTATEPSPRAALAFDVGVGAHSKRSSKLDVHEVAAEAVTGAEEGSDEDESAPSPIHDSAYTTIHSPPMLADAGMSPSRSLPASPQAGHRTVQRNLSSEPIGAPLTPPAAPRPSPPLPAAVAPGGSVGDAARIAFESGNLNSPGVLESPPDTPPTTPSPSLPSASRAQPPPPHTPADGDIGDSSGVLDVVAMVFHVTGYTRTSEVTITMSRHERASTSIRALLDRLAADVHVRWSAVVASALFLSTTFQWLLVPVTPLLLPRISARTPR